MRLIWLAIGLLSLALGAAGAVLPLLPTVPFLLLAAFCFDRSSPRLHAWLMNHTHLGPPIHDWRANGVIRRRTKIVSTAMMGAALAAALAFRLPPIAIVGQAAIMTAVGAFIWTRPEAPRPSPEG